MVVIEFDALQAFQWGWRAGFADPGMTPLYDTWPIRHRPIPLTDPIVPITPQQICHRRQWRGDDGEEGDRYGEEEKGDGGGGGDKEGGDGEEDIDITGNTESSSNGDDNNSTSGSSRNDDGDDSEMLELNDVPPTEGVRDGGQGGDGDDVDPQVLRA